jgi:hypothetical protein
VAFKVLGFFCCENSVTLHDDDSQVYIHDGLHRGEAAKTVGKLLRVEVKPGPKLEAEWRP